MADYEIISEQNKNYKLGENTQNNYEQFEVVLADIIADSTNNWDEIYVINKGQKDGIKPKQVVITKDGLVGYVKNTTAHTSTIITITDASTSFSGRARESRDKVIIKGNSELKEKNQIKIKDIPESVILKSGDLIETSGMGGLYPKGILVGKVISFVENTNPLENEAIAITSVDFNKLETVAIIINEVL